jgi:limonene 1,2-monooxygenase
MTLPDRMKFGIFLAPFHVMGENPTLGLDRDIELLQWLDHLGYDEAWIGEHHTGGWETIASPEVFIGVAAERTKHIKLGTGVISLPYHHPLMVANRMTLLDHLTRGRVMLGVGPGALITDAYMLGIDPLTQRNRMGESFDIIMRLLTESEPITYEADWFTLNEARLHLQPYTKPHFPVAVAAAMSPSGMELAGRHGASVLSIADTTVTKRHTRSLKDFWAIGEETAERHGKTMDRSEWRLVIHAYIAETRKEAIEQARIGASKFQRDYFETLMGHEPIFDGPADKIIDVATESGRWVVGTPDDLIAAIHRLDEDSGGFGGLLIVATEWGNREQVRKSYELIARYVVPQFQNSLHSLAASEQWAIEKRDQLKDMRTEALKKAGSDYEARRNDQSSK